MCRTWFQVSREQLHSAHGLVRCSRCGTVFNGLATLRDRVPEDAGAGNSDQNPATPRDDQEDHQGQQGEQDAQDEQDEQGEQGEQDQTVGDMQRDDAEAAPDFDDRHRFPLLGAPARAPSRRWPWVLAIALATLVLGGQLLQGARGELAGVPILGPALVATYRLFGVDIRPGPKLSDYAIATASLDGLPADPGALSLHGVLRNRGAEPQRLPLLSVTLTDRYGKAVAGRVLTPTEYEQEKMATLGAGRALQFRVKVADPGTRAVGFSLSLCKRQRSKVVCQAP